jgi:DNA-directed RNA polymerase subunit M/transcription elongation factor TFIIS
MGKTTVDRARKSRREWYHRNAEHAKSVIVERKQKIREWLIEYKSKVACTRCGESHPATIQFHHTDPKEKDRSISEVANNGWSIERIEKEIAKCVVLCANCHAKEHYVGLV